MFIYTHWDSLLEIYYTDTLYYKLIINMKNGKIKVCAFQIRKSFTLSLADFEIISAEFTLVEMIIVFRCETQTDGN